MPQRDGNSRKGGTRNQEGGVRTHHEGVDEDVVVLEGVEGRGGGDAVLAGLAELQRRHDGGERAEHEVVEHLHGGPERSRGVEGAGERVVGFGGGDWWIYTAHRPGFFAVPTSRRDFGGEVAVGSGGLEAGTLLVWPWCAVRVRRAERLAGLH